MAVGKKPVLTSSTALLFSFIYTLSVFCGHRTSCDSLPESSLKSRRDGRGVGNLQVDSLSSTIAADGSDGRIISTQTSGVLFDPPVLNFEEQYVGMPKQETVQVFNPSPSHQLHLNSISGDSPVFHASFFRSKVLKAGESTTFDVIFLARVSEEIHTSLYIQTSLGTFDYKVKGVGVPNLFRLRSLLGARIPLNATYSPFITMFNPFNTSLQVTEMYSSGGELHLELLTGMSQGFKSLWEIRPYETKAICRANYFGRSVTNHTSFIRIKTSHASSPSIILPVQVEVAMSPSLFLSREILDFGLLKSGESKALPLYILNAGSDVVSMKPIQVMPNNSAIKVDFVSIVLKPGSKYTKVATVTFYSDRVMNASTSGILVIRGQGDIPYQLKVPFESHVLNGSLSYDKSKTVFRAGLSSREQVVHSIPLANQFQVPVVIYDVKLPSKAQEYFTITSFEGPYVLPPDSKWYHPFTMTFDPPDEGCLFNTTLRLATNSTYFTIPIFCYDGRLMYSYERSEEADGVEFGVLSESDIGSKMVMVHNVNPVKVYITGYSISSSLTHTTIDLIAVHPTNSTHSNRFPLSVPPPFSKPPHLLNPGHSASFQVNVTYPQSPGKFSGEIMIHSSSDHVLKIPLTYVTVTGKLKVKPKVVDFPPAFPFGVFEVPLFAENLFEGPIRVESIRREPKDPRFFVRLGDSHDVDYPELQPNELVQIGTAVFDPLLEAGSESVYLGMGDSGGVWNGSYVPTPHVPVGKPKQTDPVADLKDFSQLWRAWNALLEDGSNVLNFSYVVMPSSGSEVRVPATATLIWPKVLDVSDKNVVEFTPTTIGSSTVLKMNMTNPSYRPLVVQPVLLQHYSRPQGIIDFLAEQLDPDLHNLDFSVSFTNYFTFSSAESQSSLSSLVIQPNASHQISVSFSPRVDSLANTILLIRNNLTVFDYVLLKGQGVRGVFSIDGVQPGSEPLLFEFTQAMMEKCRSGPLAEPMKLSRVLSMHNSGSTPLTLYLVGVGSGGKEEDGFTIVNYKREIIIKPNRTKTIEIFFAPDFTISRLSSTLSFKTSSGTELLYPLLAIIPHNLLAICYAMQPRPEWEQTLAWLSIPFWLCVLVTVVAVTLVQTKFGAVKELSYQNDPALPVLQATGGTVFDLRNVDPARVRTSTTASNSSTEANGMIPETVTASRSHSRSSSPSISRSRPSPVSSASGQRDHSPLLTTSSKHVPPSFTTPSSSATSRMDYHPQAQASSQQRTQTQDSEQKVRETSITHGSSTNLTNRNTSDTMATSSVKLLTQSKPKENSSTQEPSAEASAKDSSTKEKETDSHSSDKSHCLVPKAETVVVQTVFDNEQVATAGTKLKKPSDLEVMEDKVFEPSESGYSPTQEGTVETISPTTGVYTAPSQGKKQQRNSRKPVNKSSQKTGQSSGAESTPPPQGQILLPLKRDHIVRKESESSLKSADSESTTSSSDKSEEKEMADLASSQVSTSEREFSGKSDGCVDLDNLESPLESKAQVLSQLGKEPNTGQTMLPSDDMEVILTEDLMKKDKGKTKRKQRQLKKEEKARKKEKDKGAAVSKAKEKQRQTTGSCEDVSRSESTPEASASSDKPSAVKRLVTTKSDPLLQPRVAKSKLSPAENGDLDAPKKAKDVTDVALSTKSGQPSLSHPPPSVPSTAIKSSRGGPTKLKDIMMDPFSRNPDRSTYASKKTSSKKSSSEKNGGKSPVEVSKEEVELVPESKQNVDINEHLAEEELEEHGDGELSDKNITTDGLDGSTSSLTGKDQQQQSIQTPHDLASSLLSKIPMKIRKVQSSPSKSTDSMDCEEEEEGELATASGTSVGQAEEDSSRESRTSTISPTKDDSLSSPSPPLPSGHNKPSTLSLDAQPFYPANFKPSKKQAKAAQRAKAKAIRLAEGKNLEQDILENSKLKKPTLPPFPGQGFTRDISPHTGSPVDLASMEQQPEFYQKQQHRHRSDRQSPPSPTYGIVYGPDPHRYRMPPPPPPPEAFYDSSEMMPPPSAFRRVPDQDLRTFSGIDEPPPFPHPHMDRVPPDMDPYLAKGNPQVGPLHSKIKMTPSNLYQLQQKAAQPSRLPGYLPPPPGYEGPPPMHSHMMPEEEYKQHQLVLRKRQYLVDLYRQERAALAAVYAREQARKSAEALSSLHHPSAVPGYSHDPAKHPGMSSAGSMWEDYRDYDQEPSVRPRPPPLSYGISPDDLEPPHLMPSRSRSMSGGSDIGGEILTGYHLEGQPSGTVGPPGYKRAPGSEYNTRLEHSRAGLEEEGEMFTRHEERNKSAAMDWSSAPEESTSDWRSKMNSKWFSDNSKEAVPLPSSASSNYPGMEVPPSESSKPFISSTYELFENQSIWSLNNSGSESSNLLSWALMGAEKNKNSPDQ